MMRVLLDQKPCEVQASSVSEAIAAGAALAEVRGRMVVEVIVDGTSWTSDELASDKADTTTAREVQLHSTDRVSLVCQTLEDSIDALGTADQMQQDAAEHLQAGRQAPAMANLGEAFAIWQCIQDAILKCCSVLELDPQTFALEGVPMATRLNGVSEQLRAVRDALQAQDSVGLADVLLYELPDVMNDLREMLGQLQAYAREGNS